MDAPTPNTTRFARRTQGLGRVVFGLCLGPRIHCVASELLLPTERAFGSSGEQPRSTAGTTSETDDCRTGGIVEGSCPASSRLSPNSGRSATRCRSPVRVQHWSVRCPRKKRSRHSLSVSCKTAGRSSSPRPGPPEQTCQP